MILLCHNWPALGEPEMVQKVGYQGQSLYYIHWHFVDEGPAFFVAVVPEVLSFQIQALVDLEPYFLWDPVAGEVETLDG